MERNFRNAMAQDVDEICELAGILVKEKVRSLLEIGSLWGGSFWYLSRALPIGSRVVSVDSGRGMGGDKENQVPSLRECVAELNGLGYDAHLFLDNSNDFNTIDKVRHLGPYDAIFIDGDHSYEGVKSDWTNYGLMSRNIVAFHDVVYRRVPFVEVSKLWNEIKDKYRSVTIVSNKCKMGIGVLWVSATR